MGAVGDEHVNGGWPFGETEESGVDDVDVTEDCALSSASELLYEAEREKVETFSACFGETL